MAEQKRLFLLDAFALIFRGYYAFIKFGQSLGFSGILDPLLSAWIGNIIFMTGGLIMLWKAKT